MASLCLNEIYASCMSGVYSTMLKVMFYFLASILKQNRAPYWHVYMHCDTYLMHFALLMTGWSVWVHPVCLLQHLLPQLLVERRQVSRTCRPDAGTSLRVVSQSNSPLHWFWLPCTLILITECIFSSPLTFAPAAIAFMKYLHVKPNIKSTNNTLNLILIFITKHDTLSLP